MKHLPLSASSVLALLVSSTAALAVTPEQVWTNWQAMVTATGGMVEGTATRTGDTLEATGVKVTLVNPEDGGKVIVAMDKIAFRDRGDDTVEITVPSSYPFTTEGVSDGPGSFTATLDQKGLSIIASGTAEATNYDIAAEEYAVTFGDFTETNGLPVDLTAKLVVAGLAATYAVSPGDTTTGLEAKATATSTTFDLAAKDPDDGLDAKFAMTIGPLNTATKGVVVSPELMENMSEALKAGFFIDSSTTIGPITMKGEFKDRAENGKIDAALSGVTAKVLIDSQRFDYGLGFNGANVLVSGSELPMPEASAAFGELSFGFNMPVAQSDTPQDFGLSFRLVDLTAADVLWSIFDPAGQLLRDPMTFVIALNGTGRWTADIMDPVVQAQPNPPGELNSLNMPELLFKALGGQIDGTGALTFDNSDMATFGGIPTPTGKIVLNLKGINGLIDTAVAMGLISEDEVIGFRMGLAMMARPGAGPDELISEIEFKDRGLFVNGQQLQ